MGACPRALLLLLASVVLVAGPACERRTRTQPAAAPPPPVATPEPPRPGHATLAFRGAVTKEIDGDGAACGDHVYSVSSADLGDASHPAWSFSVFEAAPGAATAQLSIDDDVGGPGVTYTWKGAPAAPQLALTPSSARVQLTLAAPGEAQVEVSGELRCQTYSSAPVPEAITALLARHAGATVRPYSTYDFGRARYVGAASAIVVGDQVAFEAKLRRLRRELPPGWVAYGGTTNFLGDEDPPDGAIELVVAPGDGPLDIVRDARADAVNYGLQTEALLHRLSAWHRAWGIDVIHAETDTIELELRRLPDDMAAFAREVYAFCPDVVDQGTGTVAALQREITERRRVFLWWD